MARPALKAAAFATLCALLGVVAFAIVDASLARLDNAQRERDSLVDRYVDLAKSAASRAVYGERLQEMKAILAAAQARLPAAEGFTVPAARLEASIRRAAAAERVELVSLSLADSRPREFYAERGFTVRAWGDYRRIAAFLQRLSTTSEELRTVVRASVRRRLNSTAVFLTAEVRGYGYLSDAVVEEQRRAAAQAKRR